MTLDEDLLKSEKLFSLRFAKYSNDRGLLLEPIMIAPDECEMAASPGLHAANQNSSEQERLNLLRNISIALIHSIGYSFSDQLDYGWIRNRPDVKDSYFAVLKSSQETIPVAFLVASEEPEIYCASNVKEFLQSNLDAIFLNISFNADTNKPLKKPVRKMSAYDLLSGKVSYPEKPRSSEYDSLEDYIANGRNEVKIGDKIKGVELTGKQKKSGYGTFSVSMGNRQPVTVIVNDSIKGDILPVQFTEKINNTMYRAVQYTAR